MKKIAWYMIGTLLLLGFLGANTLAVEKPTSLVKSCVTQDCHADYYDKPYLHGPVALHEVGFSTACKPCHDVKDPQQHTFTLPRQGAELCSFCHLEQTVDKHIHEPLKTGDCLKCHDPHSSEHRMLIKTPKISDLCNECHEGYQKKKFLHGPVASGECTLCHQSHSSDHENLLTMKTQELCFFCHEVTREELKRFEFVHKAVADKGCLECHDAHGADTHMILKSPEPALCYSCHEEIKNTVENSKHKHSVVAEPGGCSHCHTPHASTVRFNLKANPLTLCVTCHNEPIILKDGTKIADFQKEIKDKKFLHGPVQQKECSSCHVTHGSDHFRLLIKEFPPQFYAPYNMKNYDLCFSCHQATLVQTKQTANLTDFRNGSLNLHYLHVNKPERGRTCRTCHATHASNHPKHIRTGVPYGKWEIPIRFTKTDTGGSCSPGCHKPRDYDRQNPVTYPVPKPDAPPVDPNSPSK